MERADQRYSTFLSRYHVENYIKKNEEVVTEKVVSEKTKKISKKTIYQILVHV